MQRSHCIMLRQFLHTGKLCAIKICVSSSFSNAGGRYTHIIASSRAYVTFYVRVVHGRKLRLACRKFKTDRVFVWSENSLAGCVCVFRCEVGTAYVLLATWRSIKFACRTERFKYTRQCKSSIDRVTRKQLPRADATQCATTRIASRRRARSAAEPSLYNGFFEPQRDSRVKARSLRIVKIHSHSS